MKMKKFFIVFFIPLFSFCSGGNKSMNNVDKEVYMDSLIDVASGVKKVDQIEDRREALSILRNEYPKMSRTWDKIEKSIDNKEVFSQ